MRPPPRTITYALGALLLAASGLATAIAAQVAPLAPSSATYDTKPPETPNFEASADHLVSQRVGEILAAQMEEWRVPGAAVAIVENGRVVVLAGYGLAKIDSQEAVDPANTVFHLASISKPVTATVALQRVDRGELALDRDINEYLETFRIPAAFPQPVTMAHLLTHSGGFDERLIARKTRTREGLLPLRDYLQQRMPPRVRPPGFLSVYSNHGYALAGLLIEEVSGEPFEDVARRDLFEPLGMNSTSFALRPEIESRFAAGYGWRGADDAPVPLDYIQTGPASMLRSTVADMARWMIAVLEGGEWNGRRVLSPASASALVSRQFSNHPALPGRTFGLSQGNRFDPPEVLHAGGAPGFTSALVLLPGQRVGILVTFNNQGWIWGAVNEILDIWQTPDNSFATEAAPAFADVERFVGFYREVGTGETTIEKIASLVSQERVTATGNGEITWRGDTFRASEDLAFRRVGGRSMLGFVEERDAVRYLSYPGTVQERVATLESLPAQAGIWLLFFLVFLAGCGGWVGPILPLYRRRLKTIYPFRSRWPLQLAAFASLINALFIILLAVTLAVSLDGGGGLAYGIPGYMFALMTLPLIATTLAAAVSVGTLVAWVRGDWARGTRVRLTVVTLALLAFIVQLDFWNLIGFRF